MCPSRASNVVTGPGTTGLHWLRNAAANEPGSPEKHPGRNREAPGGVCSARHRGWTLTSVAPPPFFFFWLEAILFLFFFIPFFTQIYMTLLPKRSRW